MKSLFIFSFLLLSTSCAYCMICYGRINSDDSIKNKETLVVNNPFMSGLSIKEFTWKKIISTYGSVKMTYRFIQNIHYREKRDTLVNFFKGGDSIYYYKAYGNSYPKKIILTSDLFSVDGNIKIGVKKDVLISKFKLQKAQDILKIQDSAGNSQLTVLFYKNKAVKIIYEMLYED